MQILVLGDEAGRAQNLVAVGPVHVVVDIVDVDAGQRQRIDGQDIYAVLLTQFARRRQTHAAVVNVVRPADQYHAGFARFDELGERRGTRIGVGALEALLRSVCDLERPVGVALPDAQLFCHADQVFANHVPAALKVQRWAENAAGPRAKRGRLAHDERQRAAPWTYVALHARNAL